MKFIIVLFYVVFLFYEISCNKNSNSNLNSNKLKNEKFSNTNKKSLSSASSKFKNRLQFKSLINMGLGFLTSKNVNVKMLNDEQRFQGYPMVTVDNNFEIGQGPIYFQGWNKYFLLEISGKSSSNTGMKNFVINSEYELEQSEEFKNSHKNSDSSTYIPESNQFYFILTNEYLSIISSRFTEIAKTIDVIEIRRLYDILVDQSSKAIKGGVEDLGNFQEGFCFQVRGNKKSSLSDNKKETDTSKIKWVICAEDYESKCELMKKLILLRLKHQEKCASQKDSLAITNIKFFNEPIVPRNTTETSKWVNLQDWSTCTLACGGGTQTLHRYCLKIPDGSDCEGHAIVTRPCNTQPCTNVTDEVIDTQLLPTQIRIVPVSLRPQKYIKCEIKEEDLDIIRYDIGNLRIPPRIPSRVIMNNQTLTIFEAGTLDSIVSSYKLNEIKYLEIYAEDRKCLKIGTNKNKFSVMCVMCTDTSSVDPEKRIKNWIEDIREFTHDCKFSRDESTKKGIDDHDPRLQKLKKELEEEDFKKRLLQMHNYQTRKSEAKNDKTLKMAQLIAMRTLYKERKYEERLEKEELMRQQKEDEDLKNEYICEEKKKMNLLKAIIQKNEAQNKPELDLKEKIQEVEQDLKYKIIQNRKRALRKINLLRLSHERKKLRLQQQISDVRRALTQNMLSAERAGDSKKCSNSILHNTHEQYCTGSFPNDPITFMDCKNKDSFCFICCENEFGEMHLNEREICNMSCDKIYENNLNSNLSAQSTGEWKFILDEKTIGESSVSK